MKIAFDAKRFFHNTSGLGNYSRDLVRILATHFPENEFLLLAKNKNEKGKDILNLPNVLFQNITEGNFARQFKMGIDAQNADAQIFHGLSGELPLKWSKKSIKKVVTIHDLIFMRFPQFYSIFDRKIHLWKFKKAAKSADVIIAISEQTKKDIIKYLNVSEDKIRVIYQCCHAAFKQIPSNDFLNQVKEKYHLPERFLLNVGTIEERKNLENIIKALDNTQIPLIVVGKKKKSYYKRIQRLLTSHHVEVHFLEGVNMQELASIYKLADIFIYPSLFEGFGIPIIEALYSKTPVITSNVSCLPEAGGENSLYVNPLSSDDIRAKILHLWNNESERIIRAEKSFEFVQKFNETEIANHLIKVYKELI